MAAFAARIQPGQGRCCTSRAHAAYLNVWIQKSGASAVWSPATHSRSGNRCSPGRALSGLLPSRVALAYLACLNWILKVPFGMVAQIVRHLPDGLLRFQVTKPMRRYPGLATARSFVFFKELRLDFIEYTGLNTKLQPLEHSYEFFAVHEFNGLGAISYGFLLCIHGKGAGR